MSASEKLCLQWNDFKDNVSSSFGGLREDKDLTDVTLACEDGQQVDAHKVILAASSPFFKDILKRNKHPRPLIYMRGLKSEDLLDIVDFLYFGEANVFQENLDSFLALADELRLKGFTGSGNPGKSKEPLKDFKENFVNVPIKREIAEQNSALSRPQYQTPINTSTVTVTDANNQDLDD